MLTFEWDEAKRSANLGKHGIDFVGVPEMFTGSIMVVPDARKDYGETRHIGFGFINRRLVTVVFTKRNPETIRIISARKANDREKAQFKESLADQLGQN
jgi:uncharacterized DUF497 family protein